MRLLEPRHLEEDYPITTFFETKDSQGFCKRTNNILEFEGRFLRGRVRSNDLKFSTVV